MNNDDERDHVEEAVNGRELREGDVSDSPGELSRESVRQWLSAYAWMGSPDEQRRVVDCIMAQDGWQYVSARADQFAGAAQVSGPQAYTAGVEWALSALYECHDGPHLAGCPGGEAS